MLPVVTGLEGPITSLHETLEEAFSLSFRYQVKLEANSFVMIFFNQTKYNRVPAFSGNH